MKHYKITGQTVFHRFAVGTVVESDGVVHTAVSLGLGREVEYLDCYDKVSGMSQGIILEDLEEVR